MSKIFSLDSSDLDNNNYDNKKTTITPVRKKK